MILTTFKSKPGCRCRMEQRQGGFTPRFSSPFISTFSSFFFQFFPPSSEKSPLPILDTFTPKGKKRGENGRMSGSGRRKKKCQELVLFEQRVKQNVLYVHHLLAENQDQPLAMMLNTSCVCLSHSVCMCEAKADNITASHGSLRQAGNRITSDY